LTGRREDLRTVPWSSSSGGVVSNITRGTPNDS